VVVTQDNRAIPPQGTTIDMAQIREQLTQRIDQVERDAAIARGNMTLDREKSMAGIERSRLEMAADAAAARAAIRADLTRMISELERRVALLESRGGNATQSR
jgi:hypothetical protein